MKKGISTFILCILFLMNSINALAFTCTSPGGTIPAGGSTIPVDTWVNIEPFKTSGQTQLLSVGQIRCESDIRDWIDYLKTDRMDNILNSSLFNSVTGSLSINGIKYSIPISEGIQVLSVTQLQSASVDINLFLTLKNNPSQNIPIKKGDIIGEFDFKQTNDQAGCPNCGPYRWRLRANNDMIVVTNSCAINNSQAINVKFDQLRQDLLTTSADTSLYKKDQLLTFNCQGTNVSQDVKITLISDASPFSTDYIRTTNSNVGVAMIHQGKTIKPGSSFTTRLTNSNGTANITFSAVKANVASSSISTGNLSGSATLILSAP